MRALCGNKGPSELSVADRQEKREGWPERRGGGVEALSGFLAQPSDSSSLSLSPCPQLFDGIHTILKEKGGKSAKNVSWDTWFGPMAINLRQLMHINLLYNASEHSPTAVLAG